MSLNTAILLNAILDLGVVSAVAASMWLPFTLDRPTEEATLYSFAAPPPTISPPNRWASPSSPRHRAEARSSIARIELGSESGGGEI